jgi:hypothetical protein
MKTITLNRRLVLNKKTINNLDNHEMKGLHAGGGVTRPTKCYMMTCYRTCYC